MSMVVWVDRRWSVGIGCNGLDILTKIVSRMSISRRSVSIRTESRGKAELFPDRLSISLFLREGDERDKEARYSQEVCVQGGVVDRERMKGFELYTCACLAWMAK